jgi:methylated-DNA-[protein]-cysteine S-methyltransferase
MSPTATDTLTRHTVIESPVGPLTVVGDHGGLIGLYFPHHWTRPDRSTFGRRVDTETDYVFREAASQLAQYFAVRRQGFDLPLEAHGDEVSRRVWSLLNEIPYGQTTTYGDLAHLVGAGVTPRDIGAIVGPNPLSILVPCHRVVGKGGKLTGYAGGLGRKRFLLDLEHDALDGTGSRPVTP